MHMSDGPSQFKPTISAYTTNHEFLAKLIKRPDPIPYQKYFALRFAIYGGQHPDKMLPKARLKVAAGMPHGMAHGFAHGMQSSPKLTGRT